jgi:pyruvate dehydrogenase E2 component (dihydrolipoamide acetyltransferase)
MAGKSSSNPNEFLLPDLGEGLVEAELLEWCVEPGAKVQENDTIAKMETDKAVVEVPADRTGVIAQLHGNPGEKIKVGSPLVTYEGNNDRSIGDNGAEQASSESHEQQEGEHEDAGTVVGSIAGEDYSAQAGQIRAVPKVKKLARDLGVDLSRVIGTGIGGRITASDVHAASSHPPVISAPRAAAPPKPRNGPPTSIPIKPARRHGEGGEPPRNIPMLERKPVGPIPAGEDIKRIPFRGVRRRIAEHLKQSVLHAVHFTIMDDADISALDSLRARLTEAYGNKINLLPLVASAVCRVISGRDDAKFNRLNSTVDDEHQEIIQHRMVHLGVATDTEEGLMVPVIRNAEKLAVIALHEKIAEMARKARSRQIARDELAGSTFTISNFGSRGGRYGTPIINYPEAAILAIGTAYEAPIARGGMLGVGKLLPLSLSADHRVIDGGTAAEALARIKDLLENPEELLPPK